MGWNCGYIYLFGLWVHKRQLTWHFEKNQPPGFLETRVFDPSVCSCYFYIFKVKHASQNDYMYPFAFMPKSTRFVRFSVIQLRWRWSLSVGVNEIVNLRVTVRTRVTPSFRVRVWFRAILLCLILKKGFSSLLLYSWPKIATQLTHPMCPEVGSIWHASKIFFCSSLFTT